MKNLILTDKFFDILINEKAKDSDDFKIRYHYSEGCVFNVEFISGDYYAILTEIVGTVFLIEKKLKDGEYVVVSRTSVEGACFPDTALRDLESILKKLSKKHECLHKKADCSSEGITETYTFVK
jgi:hypothetical protein